MDKTYSIQGTIHQIGEREQPTQRFAKREIVIDKGTKNKPYVALQFINDRCDILDHYEEGQEVRIYFDIIGHQYNDKYYNNLNAYKIESTQKKIA